jgi:DDE superfamily endonuclease
MDIKKYYKPISQKRYATQTAMEVVRFSEELAAASDRARQIQEEKRVALEQRVAAAKARAAQVRKDRIAARRAAPSDEDNIRVLIEDLNFDLMVLEDGDEDAADTPEKKWKARPPQWKIIAEHYGKWGLSSTMKAFADDLKLYTPETAKRTLARWLKEFRAGKEVASATQIRLPACGVDVDNCLRDICIERIDNGVPVDCTVLRSLLVPVLSQFGKTSLLDEFKFGDSWARRFFKRHNIVTRVVTTKMRSKPADFDAKVENYIQLGANFVAKYNIPRELVYNADETNSQFVSNKKITKAIKGSKRVKLHGVGSDKAQVTVTLCAKEDGTVLPHQVIFGGKTTRSLPKTAPPQGCFYTFTASHWQTVRTYKEYLTKIIIPDKDTTIRRLNLPSDQKALFIHDLHFSHRDEEVMDLMARNNLVPLYIPAQCTDEIQVCDTVINKPYKCSKKTNFRDYMHREYDAYIAGGGRPADWQPKLTAAALREHMVVWIANSVESLRTEAMRKTIQEAFARDARMSVIRSEERRAAALAALEEAAAEAAEAAIIVPEGDEVDEDDDDEDEEID